MHIIDLLFCSWKTFDVKFGRYLDPFSISIDIRRSQRSRYGSYFAIDSVRLHNCEPGTYISGNYYMLNFPGICNMIKLSLFPLIYPIFSSFYYWIVFSNPLTIYDYTVYGSFLLIIHFTHFFGITSNPLSWFFSLWLFQPGLFFWNLKIKKKQKKWSKVPNWFSRIYWQTSFH